VAVANGTAALHVALLAHYIGAGDEVIVPAFSFAATANTVLHAGARPAFVDVRDDDFGIDAALIEAAITPRTRAIVAVHLYGQLCDIDAVAAIARSTARADRGCGAGCRRIGRGTAPARSAPARSRSMRRRT
jgi:dTDP-4-amino-4,6-dideoxygalactose transaminase